MGWGKKMFRRDENDKGMNVLLDRSGQINIKAKKDGRCARNSGEREGMREMAKRRKGGTVAEERGTNRPKDSAKQEEEEDEKKEVTTEGKNISGIDRMRPKNVSLPLVRHASAN
ncbi:hypothetical protein niasHS_007381 [Heterodera schachtii]|uniref:Uncharacterized protein n=1 Tax=Heterodera schachtii TaxID=97005 RepID=A0ABD2JXB5_HETSC